MFNKLVNEKKKSKFSFISSLFLTFHVYPPKHNILFISELTYRVKHWALKKPSSSPGPRVRRIGVL